jgi:hypothetical protein
MSSANGSEAYPFLLMSGVVLSSRVSVPANARGGWVGVTGELDDVSGKDPVHGDAGEQRVVEQAAELGASGWNVRMVEARLRMSP